MMLRALQRAAGVAATVGAPHRGAAWGAVSRALPLVPRSPGARTFAADGRFALAAAAAAALAACATAKSAGQCEGKPNGPVLIVGSINADTYIEINRFPKVGETLNTRTADTGIQVPGGKGANQAVAVARLSAGTGRPKAQFVCQLGNDVHGKALEQMLVENGLDISGAGHANKPSGQAFIFLEADGSNSILICGGANHAWPADLAGLHQYIKQAAIVLLQREIPEFVNEAVVEAASQFHVPVVLDFGGDERPVSDKQLKRLGYICPNETELERLTGLPTKTEEQVVAAARAAQKKGVKNVLVTLGADGSLLVDEHGHVFRQKAYPVPGGKVVDTTGAGDCFRAAFTVALVEGRPLQECLKFASAAAAIAVSRMGALDCQPHRQETLDLMQKQA